MTARLRRSSVVAGPSLPRLRKRASVSEQKGAESESYFAWRQVRSVLHQLAGNLERDAVVCFHHLDAEGGSAPFDPLDLHLGPWQAALRFSVTESLRAHRTIEHAAEVDRRMAGLAACSPGLFEQRQKVADCLARVQLTHSAHKRSSDVPRLLRREVGTFLLERDREARHPAHSINLIHQGRKATHVPARPANPSGTAVTTGTKP